MTEGTRRRIVTGHDREGRSVFISDERIAGVQPDLLPGYSFHQIFGTDTPHALPTEEPIPRVNTYFPPPGGTRFAFFTIPPSTMATERVEDPGTALRELERELPGLLEHMEQDDPGMHTTATIDIDLVVAGRPQLELDDGAVVQLEPGDTVIQNGTRHRWSNPGTEPATIAVFITGVHHRGVPRDVPPTNDDG